MFSSVSEGGTIATVDLGINDVFLMSQNNNYLHGNMYTTSLHCFIADQINIDRSKSVELPWHPVAAITQI